MSWVGPGHEKPEPRGNNSAVGRAGKGSAGLKLSYINPDGS